ncbi:septation ring formation regulator EzrA [Pseudalkalibacillus caeni]|uniref:Septation ring formation regulator EzrA n=1 Tax=Exobacillus caeni TaxID=2574798 RepID=A0A5R9FA52_9BACL|nr:septation ring formation regulator EzrA [Pseudalkalibacillus caeni]
MLPLEYIVIAIILLAIFFIISSFARRKIYKEIDRLEEWKIDILNRPVTEEIAKVKGLKMQGQTEEKFEKWRAEWDEIVTVILPNLEEQLMDTEEAAEKYRFKKAKSYLDETENRLNAIEERIKQILSEINELVSSEEQNRKDIVEVSELYRETRQRMLSHNRSLGNALPKLETELNELKEKLQLYEQSTEEGNYIQAREVLVEVHDRLEKAKEKIQLIPDILMQLQNHLPSQIKELKDGSDVMRKDGYVLDHLMLNEQLEEMENQIKTWLARTEETDIDEIKEEVDRTFEKIDEVYDLLEKEVSSRQFVTEESEEMELRLVKTESDLNHLKEETNVVQLSYRIEQQELKTLQKLEKKFEDLTKRYEVVSDAIQGDQQAYTSLAETVSELKEALDKLQQESQDYKLKLQELRKDELNAIESIKDLKVKLFEAKRMIRLYNLPGIPEDQLEGFEHAEEKIIELSERLSDTPLDMSEINEVLSDALSTVTASYEKTKELVEQALLAERLIQYGNRYRSRYRTIDEMLRQAETLFRNYQYSEALELAGEAIEKVEPGALKEMEFKVEEVVNT